jgi:hypothetical protein
MGNGCIQMALSLKEISKIIFLKEMEDGHFKMVTQ